MSVIFTLIVTMPDGKMNDRVININYNDSIKKDSSINKDTCIWCDNNFKSLLIKYGVSFPNVVLAQAKLESGNFKSNVFNKYNNPFGFRTDTQFISFNSVEESVIYYYNWQHKHYWKQYGGLGTTEESYYKFLEDYHYSFNDSTYIGKLKQINYNL